MIGIELNDFPVDAQDAFVGTYHRIHFSCNARPVYQMGDFLLLRQGLQWVVAPQESHVLTRCCPDDGCVGYALISTADENSHVQHRCPDMPDGDGERPRPARFLANPTRVGANDDIALQQGASATGERCLAGAGAASRESSLSQSERLHLRVFACPVDRVPLPLTLERQINFRSGLVSGCNSQV